MKVSVIIPTHNAENTISRCIESVLNQNYNDIEIICGDDYSTDGTYEILKNYEKKYDCIKIFRNDANKFAAYTRNACISLCTGDYIAQIDDDDYMMQNRIQMQVDFLESHPEIDFVGSQMYYFDDGGVWKTSEVIEYPTKYDFLKSSAFSNPSVTFRKTCLTIVGGYRVAKETVRGQDYDLFMRLYEAGFKGANIRVPLTCYYRGKLGYKKTTAKIRYYEFLVRWKNFKALGLMPKGILYAIKPLLLIAVPFEFLEKGKRLLVNI